MALLGDHDGAFGRDGPPCAVQRAPEERATIDETGVLLGAVIPVNEPRERPKSHTLTSREHDRPEPVAARVVGPHPGEWLAR
jgi:hypothetical protein